MSDRCSPRAWSAPSPSSRPVLWYCSLLSWFVISARVAQWRAPVLFPGCRRSACCSPTSCSAVSSRPETCSASSRSRSALSATRPAEHEEREGGDQGGLASIVGVSQGEGKRRQHDARGKISARRCRSTGCLFGASSLNRMVPATIEASEASVNTMPCQPVRADRQAVPDDGR